MCGRYATTRTEADLEDLFEAVSVLGQPGPDSVMGSAVQAGSAGQAASESTVGSDASGSPGVDAGSGSHLRPSWNVAPTTSVPVVRVSQSREARVLDTARWGLVPPWAKDLRAGARMINARAETVATSPAFAPSFARRRCLVPADGWFEWVRDGKQRRPFYMTPADGSPLAFAGVWTTWGPDKVLTFSVLTTAALGGLTSVHDRMPLILPRDRWPAWLAGGGDPAELLTPLSPAELEAIEVRPVRPDVGNVRNNGPHLLEPPQPSGPEPTPESEPAKLF